jgi:putative heme-binding domain-containing protein
MVIPKHHQELAPARSPLIFMLRYLCFLLLVSTASALELKPSDRVVYVGDTLIEREQIHGWFDVMLATRFPHSDVTFRNLGWSGDTPDGKSRLGLSLLQAGKEPADEGWRQLVIQLRDAEPTVAFLGYGMANSFEGPDGVAEFESNYRKLVNKLRAISPEIRFIFLSPIPHEVLPSPWPDPKPHNQDLSRFAACIAEIAQEQASPFIDFSGLYTDKVQPRSGGEPVAAPLTSNGIHLTGHGYRLLAEALEDQLFHDAGAWRNSPHSEKLRETIVRKNEAFFHRSRPANMAYIFGFRKREQGKNAAEVFEFDKTVAAEDRNIAMLRHLRPAEPTIPDKTPVDAQPDFTPQAHPSFTVADGLQVTLWAENPLINKPVHMNFDPQGRLWIASSTVYPQIEPHQKPNDRILVLADTTSNGRADQVTTFADGLLIPTGVLPGDGGVYVAQSTELLHLRDTDGDGISDKKVIVLSGFGTEDSHHNLHSPQWGPDGRLYVNQSVYTRTRTETPHGVIDLKAGGIFRFDPRDQKMSVHYRGIINGWGHAWDAYGQSFMSDGAGFDGIHWGVPGATYRTLAPARRTIPSITPGSYPKYAGMEVIQSDLFPADWQGDLVTCDYRANRVVRFKTSERGSGFIAHEEPEILRTVADSFRPVDVKLGPDGALYIADWSNPIIQHGEVDFRDKRRDKVHGRIWRVTPIGHHLPATINYASLSTPELLDQLLATNATIQNQARRVLSERGRDNIREDLIDWESKQDSEPAQLQSLWLRVSLNLPVRHIATPLLLSSDPSMRAAAVRSLSMAGATELAILANLVRDPHPRVRLEAVRALGRFPTAESATLALGVLDAPMDPFLDYALWLTINELNESWVSAVRNGSWSTTGREDQLAFALLAILPEQAAPLLAELMAGNPIPTDGSGPWIDLIQTAGGPTELDVLFDLIITEQFPPPVAARALEALQEAARLRSIHPLTTPREMIPLLTSPHPAVQTGAIRLMGAWNVSDAVPELIKIIRQTSSALEVVDAAFSALRRIDNAVVIPALKEMIENNGIAESRLNQSALVLAAKNPDQYLPLAVSRLNLSSTDADFLWRELLQINGAGARLAKQLTQSPVSETVAQAGLRPAREGNQNPELVRVLLQQAGLSVTAEKLTPALMQDFAITAEKQGNPIRGETLYRQSKLACVSCHAIGGAGGKLGPDLSSIGTSAPTDYLVEAMLYPNDKIKEGYHAALLMTTDGQAVSGMIIREDEQEIVVRNTANEEISLASSQVSERINIGSLMPAGLMDTLLPQERYDLIKFLSLLGKPGEYDASRSSVARQWHLYVTWSGNREFGVERVTRGDLSLPHWIPLTSRVNGIVPADEYASLVAHTHHADDLFLAVRFEVAEASDVTFEQEADLSVGNTTRAEAWLNGESVAIDKTFTVTADAGINTLVFRTGPGSLPTPLRLSSSDVVFLND